MSSTSRGRRRAAPPSLRRPRRNRRRPPRRRPLPNLRDPVPGPDRRDLDGWRARRVRLGGELGTERLGVSLWELPPGQCAYPYHFHLADEELLVVLSGTPELRDASEVRTLAEGELVAFRAGEEGGHQLVNRTEAPVRFLAVSTAGTPDVVLYPEHGKVFAGERVQHEDGVRFFFRTADAADYWDGIPEEPE